MVADPQGEAGGQYPVVQLIIEPLDGDAFRLRPHAEDGDVPLLPAGKPELSVADHRGAEAQAHQSALGPMVAEVLQQLVVGYRVVEPWAVQAAVDQIVPEALSQLHRQHAVGVVLLHGVDLRPGGNIVQGVEVPDDGVGGQSQLVHIS